MDHFHKFFLFALLVGIFCPLFISAGTTVVRSPTSNSSIPTMNSTEILNNIKISLTLLANISTPDVAGTVNKLLKTLNGTNVQIQNALQNTLKGISVGNLTQQLQQFLPKFGQQLKNSTNMTQSEIDNLLKTIEQQLQANLNLINGLVKGLQGQLNTLTVRLNGVVANLTKSIQSKLTKLANSTDAQVRGVALNLTNVLKGVNGTVLLNRVIGSLQAVPTNLTAVLNGIKLPQVKLGLPPLPDVKVLLDSLPSLSSILGSLKLDLPALPDLSGLLHVPSIELPSIGLPELPALPDISGLLQLLQLPQLDLSLTVRNK